MRTTYTVPATVLLLSAFPSVSVAQIVVPYRAGNHVARLNHGVPVATVTPPDDGIAVADPKPGIDHVLGAATVTGTANLRLTFAVTWGRCRAC